MAQVQDPALGSDAAAVAQAVPAPPLEAAVALPAPSAFAPATGFSEACVGSLILGGLALLAAFSNPLCLVVAFAFGGYALHLYRGGREFAGVMPDGRPRARAWLAWAAVALIALVTAFKWAPAFLIVLGSGAYAAYLFSGGRDVTREAANGMTRSLAWLYWGAISVVSALLGFSHPGLLVVAVAAGLYSTYLFRGGRWVLWIW